jgi:hypothetical protein
LLHFVVIWYIFPRFGILYQENSGNPVYLYDKIIVGQSLSFYNCPMAVCLSINNNVYFNGNHPIQIFNE